jgi:hypothetical protein
MRAINSDGMVSSPRNFMKPEERRSYVTPAGTSIFAESIAEHVADGRISADQRRRQQAQLARDAEVATRLSGHGSVRLSPRIAAQQGWEPTVVRDSLGRLRVDWSRVGSDLPHDDAGRRFPTTSVDDGTFKPGADFW